MELRLVLKNAAALSVASVLSKVITAVVGIAVTRYLGPEIYGEYSSALAFVSTFILFADFGLSNYMVQEGSRDEKVLPLFLGNTLLFKVLTSLALYLLMLGLMFPAGYNQSIRSMVMVLGLASALNALDASVYNYFQAKQQMYVAAIYQFLSTFLIGALTILVVLTQGTVVMITAAQLVTAVLISLSLYAHLRRQLRLEFDLSRLLGMLRQGLPYGMAVIFLFVYFQIDMFMLSLMKPPIEVGVYSAAYRLIAVLLFIPGILTSVIYPILFQLGVESKEKHRGTIEKIFKVLSAVGIPGSVLIFVLADPLLTWLYNGRFPASIPILMLLSWFFAFECLSFSLGDVLTTTDRQWTRAKIQGGAALLNIGINLYAIPRYGIYGASVATLITELYVFIAFYWVVRRYVYKVQVWRQLPVIILASFIMGLIAHLFRGLHPLISASLAGAVYLIILIGLDNDFQRIGGYILRQLTSRLRSRS
ncbi:membrane protein involved in the export of O-antigen and teichoic acid [Desulfosporosinus orientis DSM 765]|uniref:Membrane protein involved in the export of O-antigen and teichoic acid n=1 Tax=Desulfosporosinus orientis (strain ATCC 19365 / DSM 765 / NCIMB 8382 / VKM B-1628 / Singapore I) TaxID=768706 RepID=G7WC91_DESOD|nr:flippase [Desulfosporosinus orientis]AET70709.1 membrane protein involved in the export of O-antigen and teichoic acid [Desulfosporosinus orientis DSM 765]